MLGRGLKLFSPVDRKESQNANELVLIIRHSSYANFFP